MSRYVYLEHLSSTESMQARNRLGAETYTFDGSGGVATLDYSAATCTLDTTGGGWAGFVTLFKGRTGNVRNVNAAEMYGSLLESAYQGTLVAFRVYCNGTAGKTIKIRIENDTGTWLQNADVVLAGGQETINFALSSSYPNMNRIVIEAGADSSLIVTAIELDIDDHVFSNSYEQISFDCFTGMLRLFEEDTNRVLDTNAFDYGERYTTAMGGALAMMLYMAVERGWVSLATAQVKAAALINQMLAAPNVGGWMAHFLKAAALTADGSEYATVDTAIGIISADIAARGLGLTAEAAAVAARIQSLDYSATDFIHGTQNRLSHGYDNDGVTVVPYYWDYWGAEDAITQIVYWMKEPNAPAFSVPRDPPSWNGVGAWQEMGALWFANLGVHDMQDAWGVNWKTARIDLRTEQKAVHPTATLYGYSEAEIRRSETTTEYWAFGSGGDQGAAVTTDGGGYGPWVTPSFLLMNASSDPVNALVDVNEAKFQALTRPYGVAESAKLDVGTDSTVSVHWRQSSLRLFFCSVGAYHAALQTEIPSPVNPIFATAASGLLGAAANQYAPVIGGGLPVGDKIAIDTSPERSVIMSNSTEHIGDAFRCYATLVTRRRDTNVVEVFNLVTGGVTALSAALVFDPTGEELIDKPSVNSLPADWVNGQVYVEFTSEELGLLNLRRGYYRVRWTATIDGQPETWVGQRFLAAL